jgi:ketosteroid isomerase-like protein
MRLFPETELMKILTAAVLSIVASAALAQSAGRPDIRDTKIDAELKALVRQWDAAMVKKDPAALERILADEFTLSGMTKSQLLAFVRSSENTTISAVSEKFDIRVYGNTAVLLATDVSKRLRDGEEVTDRMHYMDVWVKRDNRWQCVATELSGAE